MEKGCLSLVKERKFLMGLKNYIDESNKEIILGVILASVLELGRIIVLKVW